LGIQYDVSKNLSMNAITGENEVGQSETKLGFQFNQTLPDIMGAKKGDTVKPHYERADAYSLGVDKYQLNWETDKVTKSEVRLIDENGQVVQDILEKTQHSYYHQMVIEGLKPTLTYKVEILSRDLNENQAVTVIKIAALEE
jgi:hypothetical protein